MILVKICGITNWPDAVAACDAGANMLGFNFYEKSLRRVSTVEAATIRAKLPPGVQAVGLFVNAKPAEINSLHAFVRFNAAQLHGDETPAIVSEVTRTVPVIKAFRVATSFELIERIPDTCIAVSESGLRTHDDLTKLRNAGFDAFLIGESLMLSPDPAAALGAFLGRSPLPV